MSHKILLAALDFAPELNGKYFCNVDPFRKIFPVFSSSSNNPDEETFLRSTTAQDSVNAATNDPAILDAQNSLSPLAGNHSLATSKYFPKSRTMLPVLLVSTRPFAQALTPNLLSTTTIGIKILFELFFASHVGLCSFPLGTLQYTRKLSVSYSLGLDFEILQYEEKQRNYRIKFLTAPHEKIKSFWASESRETTSTLVEIFPLLEVFSFAFPASREYQPGQVCLKNDHNKDNNSNCSRYAFYEVPENGGLAAAVFVNNTICRLSRLRSLSLYRCRPLNHEAIFNITETLPNLHEIELGGNAAKWDYNVLDFIHPCCANRLTHLVLAFPIFGLLDPLPFTSPARKSLLLQKIKDHNTFTNFGELEVLVLQFPGSNVDRASVFVKNVLDSHESSSDRKLLNVVKAVDEQDENATDGEFCLWESSLFEKIADNYSGAALPKLHTLMLDGIAKHIRDPTKHEHDTSGSSGCFGAKIVIQALTLLPSAIRKLDFRFQLFGSNHEENKKILNDLFAALSGVSNNLRLEWIDLTGCSGVCDRHIVRHLVPKHKDSLIHLGLGYYGDGRELREGGNDDDDSECQFTENVFIEGISRLENLKYLDVTKTSPYIATWKGLTSLVALRNSLEELYLNDITYHYDYEIHDNNVGGGGGGGGGGTNSSEDLYEKNFTTWKEHQENEAIVAAAADSIFQLQYDETLIPNFPLHPLTVNFLLKMKSLKVLSPFNSYHFCSTDLAAILRALPLLRSLKYFSARIEYDFQRVRQRHCGYRSNSACKRLHEFRAKDESEMNFYSSNSNTNVVKLPATRQQHENTFSFVRNLMPLRDSFIKNGILKVENVSVAELNRIFDSCVEGTDLRPFLRMNIKTGMLLSFDWREFIYRNVMWRNFQGLIGHAKNWSITIVTSVAVYTVLKCTSLDDQYVRIITGILAIVVSGRMMRKK